MKVSVLGASGYAGGELLRLISQHPEFEFHGVFAGSNAGEEISKIHPHLQFFGSQKFAEIDFEIINSSDLVFCALPHGESSKVVSKVDSNIPIIDLGADFRLSSSEKWKKYYSGEYSGKWFYGLPEISNLNDYKNLKRIANPGCYATAIILGAAPLIKMADVDVSDLVVVAASGTTGAGRSAKLNLLGSEVMNNLTSYKFAGAHQHTPEIEESLASIGATNLKLSFTPILAPMPRGILATLSFKLIQSVKLENLRCQFENFYQGKYFVKILSEGSMPNTSAVLGSNFVQIQVGIDEHASRITVSVAIDNLGKGAAGQAIQNANLIMGLEQTSGLQMPGIK